MKPEDYQERTRQARENARVKSNRIFGHLSNGDISGAWRVYLEGVKSPATGEPNVVGQIQPEERNGDGS